MATDFLGRIIIVEVVDMHWCEMQCLGAVLVERK